MTCAGRISSPRTADPADRQHLWQQLTNLAGFSIVAVFAYRLSALNLDTGSADFFWPIILRAIGLSLIAVPLTQLAVSGLKPNDIPQGVALNNMMRQLGVDVLVQLSVDLAEARQERPEPCARHSGSGRPELIDEVEFAVGGVVQMTGSDRHFARAEHGAA